MKADLNKLLRFFLWGVPSFILAFGLNYLLVKQAGLSKPPAYAIVLVMQVTLNFFLCRAFVFTVTPGLSLWKSFAVFMNGILLFRVLDWAVYSVLTTQFDLSFVGVQLFNVALFGLLKYFFARRVFEKPAAPAPAPSEPERPR